MTTIDEAAEALHEYFDDLWTPTGHLYAADNEVFKTLNAGNNPFARFTMRIGNGTQETLGQPGNRKFIYTGSCFIQIFTLINIGAGESQRLAEIVTNGFHGSRIVGTTIVFRDVSPRRIGPEEKWYQANVEVAFDFTDTR